MTPPAHLPSRPDAETAKKSAFRFLFATGSNFAVALTAVCGSPERDYPASGLLSVNYF
jgi:hypothetical protein